MGHEPLPWELLNLFFHSKVVSEQSSLFQEDLCTGSKEACLSYHSFFRIQFCPSLLAEMFGFASETELKLTLRVFC